jgi:hypothetical protein
MKHKILTREQIAALPADQLDNALREAVETAQEILGKGDDQTPRPFMGYGIPRDQPAADRGAIKPIPDFAAELVRKGWTRQPGDRVSVDPGVLQLQAAVTSPTIADVGPARIGPIQLGADRRYLYLALRAVGVPASVTAIDWTRQSVRALASPATMLRALDAVTNKPESAITVVLQHTALQQVATVISGIPNIVLKQDYAPIINNEVRLALAEALDAQAVAAVNDPGRGRAVRGERGEDKLIADPR